MRFNLVMFFLIGSILLARPSVDATYNIYGGEYSGYVLKYNKDINQWSILAGGSVVDWGWSTHHFVQYAKDEDIWHHNEVFLINQTYNFSKELIEFRYPPDLVIENIKFVKDDKFTEYGHSLNELHGGESGSIVFDVINYGRGSAYFLEILIDQNNTSGGNKRYRYIIQKLEGKASVNQNPAYQKQISVPISAPLATPNTTYNFDIIVSEFKGFDAELKSFNNLAVFATPKPKFIIDDITINDDKIEDSWGNNDGIINQGESIEVVVTIKNEGSGSASDLIIDITDPNLSGLFIPRSGQILPITSSVLMPEETINIKFYFIINKKLATHSALIIPLNILEKSGEFSTQHNLSFPIGQKFIFETEEDWGDDW